MSGNLNNHDDITRIVRNSPPYGTLIMRLSEIARDEQSAKYVELSTLEAIFEEDPTITKSAKIKLWRIGRTSPENDLLQEGKIVAVYPREQRLFLLLETNRERTDYQQVFVSDVPQEYRERNSAGFEFKEPTEPQE